MLVFLLNYVVTHKSLTGLTFSLSVFLSFKGNRCITAAIIFGKCCTFLIFADTFPGVLFYAWINAWLAPF